MAKCELQVRLDRADPVFRPGDTVSGEVHVHCSERVKCDGLTATLAWGTHGKGNTERGSKQVVTLIANEHWEAGSFRYPFSFVLPSGPVTYHGNYINVDWYVTAEVDIPWAFDPKASIDFVLEPAPPQLVAGGGYRERRLEPLHHELGVAKTNTRLTLSGAIALFVVLFAIGIVGAVTGDDPFWYAWLLITFSLMCAGVYKATRNRLAKRVLGDVSIDLSDNVMRRGESVDVTINIQPEKDAKIAAVNLDLTGKEIAIQGSGTNRTTHTNKLHDERIVVSTQRVLEAGKLAQLTGSVAFPKDAAPTFRADDNNVKWELTAHIDIPNWPDLEETFEIEVQPS